MPRIIQLIWTVFKAGCLSIFLMMTIGCLQLFLQITQVVNVSNFIEIGFPFHFFFFSIDGNELQGSKPIDFILDFLIIFPFALVLNYISHKITFSLQKKADKKDSDQSENRPIDHF